MDFDILINSDEAADKQEGYGSGKEKAGKKFFLKDQEGETPTAHFIRKRKVKVRPLSFYNQ